MQSMAMGAAIRNIPHFTAFPRPPLRTSQGPDLNKDQAIRLSELHKIRRCKQVAAVCYRIRREAVEFLLVRTRSKGRWTFPKGCTEPGLTHAQAAALEAFEEAGVHGRIEEMSFTRYVLRRRGDSKDTPSAPKTREIGAHLCHVLRLSAPKELNRNRTWFSIEEAKAALWDGRRREDRDQFTRVIDKAVARIQHVRQSARPRSRFAPRWDALQFDAIQRAQFEANRFPHSATALLRQQSPASLAADRFSPSLEKTSLGKISPVRRYITVLQRAVAAEKASSSGLFTVPAKVVPGKLKALGSGSR
jgi:8-oxo-dGTP pyrophosphatase MutT (NUDIX family)